jgi:hypothetical protein
MPKYLVNRHQEEVVRFTSTYEVEAESKAAAKAFVADNYHELTPIDEEQEGLGGEPCKEDPYYDVEEA